jgi:glycine dehydrogenase subunit 2
MVEPTETESYDSLQKFIEVMKKIRQECDNEPEKILGAPHNTPVKRVDTVLAAKKPVLKWGD